MPTIVTRIQAQNPEPITTPPPTREELRAQVREQVEAARQAARDAAEAAREQARIAREQARIETVQEPPQIFVGTEMPPRFPPGVIPPEVVQISIGFFVLLAFIIVGWPIARAMGRRIDRKSAAPQLDSGITSQLQRIEHTVEAMAIEVERISEAQRYMARLESERGRETASLRSGEGS
jgi:hypothetical protein